MKSSKWAKNIFSVTYYLMFISWIAAMGVLLYAIFINSQDIIEIMKDSKEFKIKSDDALYTFLVYGLISGAVWIYILFLFKNLIQNLIVGSLFTKLQIASLKLIGQLIIFITIIDAAFVIVSEAILYSRLEVEIDLFDFWIVIAIGSFLIFLSKIFENAKNLKEENELTV